MTNGSVLSGLLKGGAAGSVVPGAGNIAGAAIGAGASVLGSLFSALSASKDRAAQKKLEEARLKQQQGQFDATSALNATQMDPSVQQRSRQKQALLASLMGSPGVSHPQSIDFSQANPFFSAGARQAADQQFQNTASAASPTYQNPNLSSMGYGDPSGAAAPTEMDPRRKALFEMLMANRAGRNGGQ